MELGPSFALRLDALGPVNDQRIARAAEVAGDLFGPLERSVHRPRPTDGHVWLAGWLADLVDPLGRALQPELYAQQAGDFAEGAFQPAFGVLCDAGKSSVCWDMMKSRIRRALLTPNPSGNTLPLVTGYRLGIEMKRHLARSATKGSFSNPEVAMSRLLAMILVVLVPTLAWAIPLVPPMDTPTFVVKATDLLVVRCLNPEVNGGPKIDGPR